MARVLGHPFMASYDRAPKLSVLDFDATEAPAPGQQEQRRYEGSEGGSGFWPRHVYEGLSGRLSPTVFKGTRCHAMRSQAGTWARPRRVVSTVAVSEQGVHTRCVGTDLEPAGAKVLYRPIYGARGHMAHASKDHKRYLQSARTAGQRFEAQQCRGFLHAAAEVFRDTL